MKNFSTLALLKKLGRLGLCLLLSNAAYAQEPLTLEQSLALARQHNVALRQARHLNSKADLQVKRSKFAYLPSIAARADLSRSNGLFFDNVAGELRRGSTTTSYPYLAGEVVLFDGFSKLYELQKARYQSEASGYTAQQALIDLETNVTQYYLQALVELENTRITESRIELLQAQLGQTEKLEQAGVLAQDEVYQIKAQLATEKLNLISHKNNYRRAQLQLAQEINAPGSPNYSLQAPAPALAQGMALLTEEEVLALAQQHVPLLKASGAALEAAKSNLKLTRSNFSPTLRLEGIVGSNYSSNIVEAQQNGDIKTLPYFDQLDLNQRKVVGLSLDIPVFNGLSRHFDAQSARLDVRNAELDLQASRNQLLQTVQLAYQDVLAAHEKYNTVMANLEYTRRAFASAKRRYELGTIDFFSYMESLNNMNRTEAELLQSQCELYFKHRILALYTNQP